MVKHKITSPTDLVGYKTGFLTVIKFHNMDERSKQHWLCHCNACGKDKIMARSYLLSGKAKSCGCRNGYHSQKQSINTYKLDGEYGIGYTAKGEEFYFDIDDYDKIKDKTWNIRKDGYVESGGKNKQKLHRVILGITDENVFIDHIHHNKRDNRKSELRIVTPGQNNMNNVPRKHSSKKTGVSWHKGKNAWIAQIGMNNKLIYLGIYKNYEDAVAAREAAEKKYFGEYAYNAI